MRRGAEPSPGGLSQGAQAGGFRKPFLMEDVELVRRVRSLGRILFIPEPVRTRADRYLQEGVLRVALRNNLLLLLDRLGARNERLRHLYYKGGRP